MTDREKRSTVTRREVDRWLAEVAHQIRSVLNGPAGEIKARLALIERKIARWRERLGSPRRPS